MRPLIKKGSVLGGKKHPLFPEVSNFSLFESTSMGATEITFVRGRLEKPRGKNHNKNLFDMQKSTFPVFFIFCWGKYVGID